MDSNKYSNIDVFRNYTVSAQRVTNAIEAPYQIDAALLASITHRLPSYLEVLEDVWRASSGKTLEYLKANPFPSKRPISIIRDDTQTAVDDSVCLLE